jgi:HTH-type transcriptional regulator, sugar sensing transcriptional regulator
MSPPDLPDLEELGFSLYERRALAALGLLGVADAASLCRQGDIPTSKIYLAMEKLARLGLCEIQRARPKLYSALPSDVVVDRLVEIVRGRAEDFASRSSKLRAALARLPGKLQGRRTFVDLALGTESHVKRHLSLLATAKDEVLSYVEEGDLAAISRLAADGFDVLKRLARAVTDRGIQHRVIFGFSDRTAPRLVQFLRTHEPSLSQLSGRRYSGEIGHPFHVVDHETVILSLDHPFVPEGRFASLLVRDRSLAASLTTGFEALWQKGLKDLGEVKLLPRGRRAKVAS